MAESSTAATSAVDLEYGIKLGTWINWSRGPIYGATLTVTRRDGNLLIAFTAFFIGIVASRVWRILCFALHRWYSTPRPREAIYHQRQAILRNSSTAESGVWSILQLFWAWRQYSRNALRGTLTVFLCGLASLVGFTLASGFSSRVSTAIGNEVLLDGSNCGLVYLTGTGTVQSTEAQSLVVGYRSKVVGDAANYVQQCYTKDRPSVFDCSTFVANKLSGTINQQAPCPFEEGLCRNNSANILLDTGYIDSHNHLGINTPESDRILFRHVFHCAPLVTDGHKSDYVNEFGNFTRYDYGRSLTEINGSRAYLNWTYEVESWEYQYRIRNSTFSSDANFRLSPTRWYPFNGSTSVGDSTFLPIAGMRRYDGDVHLNFLTGNGVKFINPSPDEWYRPRVVRGTSNSVRPSDSGDTYAPEEAASPMGCVEQYQYCNAALPEESRCGPLGGIYDSLVGAAPLFNLTVHDILYNNSAPWRLGSRFEWYANVVSLGATSIGRILGALGPQALLAQQNQLNGVQSQIADNQWQLDVQHWRDTFLASLQNGFVGAAKGPLDGRLAPYQILPADSFQQEMCQSQKIQTTQYSSISLFGLCFIFITGFIIILVSYTLDPMYEFLTRRRNLSQYKNLEWDINDSLYLQRLAYQGYGRGRWHDGALGIPLTTSGDMFETLVPIREEAGYPPEKIDRKDSFKSEAQVSESSTPTDNKETKVDPDIKRVDSLEDDIHAK